VERSSPRLSSQHTTYVSASQTGSAEKTEAKRVAHAPPAVGTAEYAQAAGKALAAFMGLPEHTELSEVNRNAQAQKLFLWRAGGGDSRSVNAAWRGASEAQRQAMLAQMQTLYPVVQPALHEAPHVLVVPGGLHTLHMPRMRALQQALLRIRQVHGDEALKHIHIYFVGGRELMKEECQSVDKVMAAGLAFFCEAQWSALSEDDKNTFLRHFVDAQEKALGAQGLQLPLPQGSALREKDSMKQIWMQSPELESLRQLIPTENVHFHESPVAGKDNTQGNARLVLDKGLKHRALAPGEKRKVLVCSDPYCLPRAFATFNGYFESWGWETEGFSAAMTGNEGDQLAESDLVFTTLGLREAACYLNQYLEASRDPKACFDSDDIRKKYLVEQ